MEARIRFDHHWLGDGCTAKWFKTGLTVHTSTCTLYFFGWKFQLESCFFVQLGSCQLPTCLPSCQDSTECSWCLGLEDRRWGKSIKPMRSENMLFKKWKGEKIDSYFFQSSRWLLLLIASLRVMIEFSHHFWYSNSSDAKSRKNESWRIKAGIKRPTKKRDVWHDLTLHMVYHDVSWWTLYHRRPFWSKQISKGGKRLCSSTCSWSTQGSESEAFISFLSSRFWCQIWGILWIIMCTIYGITQWL